MEAGTPPLLPVSGGRLALRSPSDSIGFAEGPSVALVVWSGRRSSPRRLPPQVPRGLVLSGARRYHFQVAKRSRAKSRALYRMWRDETFVKPEPGSVEVEQLRYTDRKKHPRQDCPRPLKPAIFGPPVNGQQCETCGRWFWRKHFNRPRPLPRAKRCARCIDRNRQTPYVEP